MIWSWPPSDKVYVPINKRSAPNKLNRVMIRKAAINETSVSADLEIGMPCQLRRRAKKKAGNWQNLSRCLGVRCRFKSMNSENTLRGDRQREVLASDGQRLVGSHGDISPARLCAWMRTQMNFWHPLVRFGPAAGPDIGPLLGNNRAKSYAGKVP